ncbi:MAG TPA: RDD family protein [Rhizomicrobium sp.]|nr:RDD family protein [Rhizomicrobium sp.]
MSDLRGGTPSASTEPVAVIAGFWRRIFALLIDMLLLGAVGIAIGAVAFRQVVALGQEGRLIGAAVTLVYYGILNSSWGGGTIGKRAMGLRVVGRDGKAIGLFRSLVRTVVFWTPYYLNGVFFSKIPGLPDDSRILAAAGVLDGMVVFGGLVFIAYLYLFNTRTRQSLHDLIVGSYVVRSEPTDAPVKARFWPAHLLFASLLTVILVAVPLGLLAFLWNAGLGTTMSNTEAVQSAVLAYPGVDTASVAVNTMSMWTSSSGTTTTTTLAVTAGMRVVPVSMTRAENGIAAIVLRKSPSLMGCQRLSVSVAYGYDLGIFRWTVADGFAGDLQQWRERLGPAGGSI